MHRVYFSFTSHAILSLSTLSPPFSLTFSLLFSLIPFIPLTFLFPTCLFFFFFTFCLLFYHSHLLFSLPLSLSYSPYPFSPLFLSFISFSLIMPAICYNTKLILIDYSSNSTKLGNFLTSAVMFSYSYGLFNITQREKPPHYF